MKSSQKHEPAVLLILDGWGIAPHEEQNPIKLAKTPVMDSLWDNYPHAILGASGIAVGLLPDQDGNSEAGHLNIGAGRIVEQDLLKISHSIKNGTFQHNAAWQQAMNHVLDNDSNLHLVGLLSNKNSGHSNPKHLLALLEVFHSKPIKNIYLHLFTDGRDTPKFAALGFVTELQKKLKSNEKIVTLMGRFYGMDRKKAWIRTEIAYSSLIDGNSTPVFSSTETALQDSYQNGESDEFITPRIITYDNNHDIKSSRINDNDAIVFFNLRSDRARQLSKVFVQHKFEELNPKSFNRQKILKNITFSVMTDFGPDLENILTAFPSEDLTGTLPKALSNLRQLYIAESEKFAHVTYFLNGGHANPVGGESRQLILSPSVTSYDEMPSMSTPEVTNVILYYLKHQRYNFYCANFANADMVGHTGNLQACIQAVQSIDENIGRIVKEVLKQNGTLFITADHGNVEEIINSDGEPNTEHSTNPVPFIIVSNHHYKSKKLPNGVLGNIAPTILDILDIPKPKEMTELSLLKNK